MKIGRARATFPPFIRSMVSVGVCAALLTGAVCATAKASSPSSSSPAIAKPVLRVGFSTECDGLNPFVSYSAVSWEAFLLNYDFLTWYNKDYKPVPDLATSWSHSPDGKVWTFHIRQGVKWSDGVPLTARDVAFTYNYILKNDLTFYMSYLQYVTKVTAPNDSTVVITSSRSNAMMLALYIPILPEHIWSKIPGKQVLTLSNPLTVGSGPFEIAKYAPDSYIELRANPDYFGGTPTVKTVFLQLYTTEDGLVNDYKEGALDIGVFGLPSSLNAVASIPGSKTVAVPTIGFTMLGFNCYASPKSKGNPLLRDVRIRQAIAYAIDKPKIVSDCMSGLAKVGTTVLSPAMEQWHWQPPANQLVTYDPGKAKAILDAAGYKTGPGGVREDAKGHKLAFKLDALTDEPAGEAAAKIIAGYLDDVGIKVTLDFMDEGAFSSLIYGNGGVDMYVWDWGGDIDPGYQLSAFATSQILNNNDSCYSNPTYDKLFAEQAAAVDRNQRVQIVQRMQQILYKQDPYVVLWYATNLEAYRANRWTGWQLAPLDAAAPVANYLRGTYLHLKPVLATQPSGRGLSTGAIIAIAAGAAVVVGIVLLLVLRRRRRQVEAE